MVCIMAITDNRNSIHTQADVAISIGALVLVIGVSFGTNCGYAVNPARDLGPRLFTLAAGWGTKVFRSVKLILHSHMNTKVFICVNLIGGYPSKTVV